MSKFKLSFENGLIKSTWSFLSGGYFVAGIYGFTFLQKFYKWGNPGKGEEKEFFFRIEMTLDGEPKISWFTLECLNFYEARWFYIWVSLIRNLKKVFPKFRWDYLNLKFVFNFGNRLTSMSKKIIEERTLINIVRERNSMKRGGNIQCHNPQVNMKVV